MNLTQETRNLPLHIDKELEEYIVPPTSQEYYNLFTDILLNGVRDPLIAWNDPETGKPTLVDGHNRYKICADKGFAYQVVFKDFENKEAVKAYMLSLQRGRRNLEENGIGIYYMMGRDYSQIAGARGSNFMQGEAQQTGNKKKLIANLYKKSESAVQRGTEIYAGLEKLKNHHQLLFQTAIDLHLSLKDALLLKEATEEEISEISTEAIYVEVYFKIFLEKLKKRLSESKKKPIVHNEPSENEENLEGIEPDTEAEQESAKPLKESAKLKALQDKCTDLEKEIIKQNKTIEQQCNRLDRYESVKQQEKDFYFVHYINVSNSESINKLQKAIQAYITPFERTTLLDLEGFYEQVKNKVESLNAEYPRCTPVVIKNNFEAVHNHFKKVENYHRFYRIDIGESISISFCKVAGHLHSFYEPTIPQTQTSNTPTAELQAEVERLKQLNAKFNTFENYKILQLAKIAKHHKVLKLEKNGIFEFKAYDDATFSWLQTETFESNAEASRKFAKYDADEAYFCIKVW
jgi:hypothetical protein